MATSRFPSANFTAPVTIGGAGAEYDAFPSQLTVSGDGNAAWQIVVLDPADTQGQGLALYSEHSEGDTSAFEAIRAGVNAELGVYFYPSIYYLPAAAPSFSFVGGDVVPNVDGPTEHLGNASYPWVGVTALVLNSQKAVASLTSATTVATVTTSLPHHCVTGQTVLIAGASPSAYNGEYTITVTAATTFTYTFAGGTSPATGTITATLEL